MPGTRVIKDDWEDYNNRKIREGINQPEFFCSEDWEIKYLLDKIRKLYNHYGEEDIKSAIDACCKNSRGPRPRKDFVNCVMIRLRGL
jgi:hypothetical protein